VKLKKILKSLEEKVTVKKAFTKDIDISGVTTNSKIVFPNNLFLAKKGKTFNGSDYIHLAVEAGAICILTDIYDPFLPKNIAQVITDNVNDLEATIASNFYSNPSKDLFLVGITGTNGKTTTSYLIKHLLDSISKKSGLIGTIENIIGDEKSFSTHTTPDIVSTSKLLFEMQKKMCSACVMEVSSHGLDQDRVNGLDFDVAIFTNFSQDHLDYHKNLDNYFEAKAKLFTSAFLKSNKLAVLNADDEKFKDLLEITNSKNVLSYGIKNNLADVVAKNIEFSIDESTFDVIHNDQEQEFKVFLIGNFNIYNLLTAICVGLHLNITLEKLADIFKIFKNVQGRLEKLPCAKKNIIVDYAHTPDALENVLKTLKLLKKKNSKIITVFGCGGNRDVLKRPLMAKVVEKYSDTCIVTSDNPRNEDPDLIIKDIISGFLKKICYIVEIDRKLAIEKAIDLAGIDDIVLIAGKGHESGQIFSNITIDFDDRQIALKYIYEKGIEKYVFN
jgi:UDP-N-acetylmuramoyl-L-alanyl-D-glutamate--2,6-diaminopimelate ligase